MAIFVALIFQVLFLFFAMIVNVGLLVHHKINLQNSVDLAAYYGAMKQAESLNAIAHINYQIRQSWKLLAWRYRIIGMGGNTETPANLPYNLSTGQINPLAALEEKDLSSLPENERKAYETPLFCATYVPFSPMPKDESTCKTGVSQTAIKIFGVPPATGIVSISIAIQAATFKAIEAIKNRCRYVSPFNWILMGRFKMAFMRDQGERKKAINMLANGLSGFNSPFGSTGDFREVDGNWATAGIEKTLKKNLTAPNRDTVQFQVYNGFGSDGCGSWGGDPLMRPPKWLNEVYIKPAFGVASRRCEVGASGGALEVVPVNLESTQPPIFEAEGYLNENPDLNAEYQVMKPWVNYSQAPYNSSLGFEKNPWCMGYVGVRATAKPKIPFSPLGEVTLTAKAYAKPFGGRIGPWFYKTWSPGTFRSQAGTAKTDELVPIRVEDPANISDQALQDPTRIPNYSRFPGDKKGLMSRAVIGYYTRAIFNMTPEWPFHDINLKSSVIPGIISSTTPGSSPSFNDWLHIAKDFNTENKDMDIMAWHSSPDNNGATGAAQMRLLELSAIAPDIFDTTYYSIEPTYYQTYYTRILEHKDRVGAGLALPSDLGSRMNDQALKDFNVKKQIIVQNEVLQEIEKGTSVLDYLVKNADHLLTSWAPNNLLEYGFAPNKFGKCEAPGSKPNPGQPATSGDCIDGGRTGFSVKLVSGDYLRRGDLQLGGEGATGPLQNPPPAEF